MDTNFHSTPLQALAEAQALSREMKDKFVKKNNEFRAAQV